MSIKNHWNDIYSSVSTDKVGWYTPHLKTPLIWINDLNLVPGDPIIDIGGGASTFVDDMLVDGYKNITVLDLSKQALQLSQERLGSSSDLVTWLQGDITEIELPKQRYRLWHDRAVFHFLVDHKLRQKYKSALLEALQLEGYFIISTFTPEAPPQCSGLPVQHYTSQTLSELFGDEFDLRRHQYELHLTPSGVEQSYVYCLFQRIS